jgi:hypothetical protein
VAHEHEREHAARTVHVVAEPNTANLKFNGVPMGAYPNATPYHHPAAYAAPAAELENANMNVSLLNLLLLYAYIPVTNARIVPCHTAGIDDAVCSHLGLIPCSSAPGTGGGKEGAR